MASVKEGDTRSLVLTEDLTRTQIVQYAGASGDYNPLHTDDKFTKEIAGYPGVFAHGMRPDLVNAIFLEDPPLFEGDAARRAASPTAKFFPALVAAVRERQARQAGAEDYRSLVVETAPDEVEVRCKSLVMWDPTTMDAAIEGIVWRGFDPDALVECPVTIVRADPKVGAVFTPDDAERFARSNPHAQIHEVEGATHTVHASPTLAAYLTHLTTFLREP